MPQVTERTALTEAQNEQMREFKGLLADLAEAIYDDNDYSRARSADSLMRFAESLIRAKADAENVAAEYQATAKAYERQLRKRP